MKGKPLYESGHVYEVRGVHYDAHTETTACCSLQTKLNATGKHIRLQVSLRKDVLLIVFK